nr:helix-turn-helix transcriptional regulator [Paenibacillus donghaensis]
MVDASGKSIRQVAKDIEYRFETVRQLYNDESRHFPRDLITKLCEYFQCGVGDLLVYDKEPSQE